MNTEDASLVNVEMGAAHAVERVLAQGKVFQVCDDKVCLAPTPQPGEGSRWDEYGVPVTIVLGIAAAALILCLCLVVVLMRRSGSKRHANATGDTVPDECVTEAENPKVLLLLTNCRESA